MDFLTTSEAADYVRLGERKLYELVTAGAIPCSKVAGKWLFPRHELDLWVLSGLARPAGMVAADPPPIVGGSQDDLLEWSLRESGSGLASLTEGTARGVDRLLRGEVIAAAIHFHSDTLPEDSPEDANIRNSCTPSRTLWPPARRWRSDSPARGRRCCSRCC
jgi:putative molybdopterin biosynthesis protein